MRILQLVQQELKLDFSTVTIELDSGSSVECPFELSARDFLRFAKVDFRLDNKHGNINALTNAKRAIDCQIDTALTLFGIKYDKISAASNKIVSLCILNNSDLPHKLKLIEALSFAPSGLISRIRSLRNKLEHYYKNPEKDEVQEAIELAELFVLSIESHIKLIEESFIITDKANYRRRWKYDNYVSVSFNTISKEMSLTFSKKDTGIVEKMSLTENDEVFYSIIKLINNVHEQVEMEEAFKVFLKIIGHPIPEKNVRLELK